jgi:hypothetical protein
VQKAIKEKARECGVPVKDDVDPKNTSRLCPIHDAEVVYERERGNKIGVCSKGGEKWHRDVVACWNLFIKASQRGRSCDGSSAPSLGGLAVDGSPVPLGSTAAHDPIEVPRSLWVRWKSLEGIIKYLEIPTNTLQGQTVEPGGESYGGRYEWVGYQRAQGP